MGPVTELPDTLIVLAHDQASLYEFLKSRHETSGRTLVILDQRREQRRGEGEPVSAERRRGERRQPAPESALALMSVLGFMILHRDENGWGD